MSKSSYVFEPKVRWFLAKKFIELQGVRSKKFYKVLGEELRKEFPEAVFSNDDIRDEIGFSDNLRKNISNQTITESEFLFDNSENKKEGKSISPKKAKPVKESSLQKRKHSFESPTISSKQRVGRIEQVLSPKTRNTRFEKDNDTNIESHEIFARTEVPSDKKIRQTDYNKLTFSASEKKLFMLEYRQYTANESGEETRGTVGIFSTEKKVSEVAHKFAMNSFGANIPKAHFMRYSYCAFKTKLPPLNNDLHALGKAVLSNSSEIRDETDEIFVVELEIVKLALDSFISKIDDENWREKIAVGTGVVGINFDSSAIENEDSFGSGNDSDVISYDKDFDNIELEYARILPKKLPKATPRKAVPWTDSDTLKLVQGIKKYGRNWAKISTIAGFENPRTNVQCKDRERILINSGKYTRAELYPEEFS